MTSRISRLFAAYFVTRALSSASGPISSRATRRDNASVLDTVAGKKHTHNRSPSSPLAAPHSPARAGARGGDGAAALGAGFGAFGVITNVSGPLTRSLGPQ